MHELSPRTRDFGDFYGLNALADDRSQPLWLIAGNCQAEALRLILDGVADRSYSTVRIPPVHQTERSDLGPLLGTASAA